MKEHYYYLIAAVTVAILMPLVPRMARYRILILRKMRLARFADFHERHFRGLVLVARTGMAVLAGYLLFTFFARV